MDILLSGRIVNRNADPDLAGLGWEQKFCTFNKLQDDGNANFKYHV